VDRESGLIETAFHLAWWRFVRIYLRLVHRVRVEGREHLPGDGPFVLVSNHQSHLDALVLTAQLPSRLRIRTYPIAAEDTFFDSALTSALSAATINALPVRRGRTGAHALEHLRNRLTDERCVYVLFPEGTRTRDGAIGSFKPGVGMLLAGTDVPVVPCHVAGSFEALPPRHHVPKFIPIRVTIGRALRFADVPNDRDGWVRIAEVLEREVRGLGNANGV
jgi:1-acyl-sn-glycerol-3-phosphate acyltransferase